MIVEKILGNLENLTTDKKVVSVPFEWFELEKKRISKTAADGTAMGVCISEMLKDGDILAETDSALYVCDVAPTDLIKTSVDSMTEMGRLCFELGNRHLSLKIEETAVSVPFDNPTFEYLLKLGFHAEKVCEKFVSFTECKAHGASNQPAAKHEHSHSHSHDHAHEHSHEYAHAHGIPHSH